jgi:hypothetical protein
VGRSRFNRSIGDPRADPAAAIAARLLERAALARLELERGPWLEAARARLGCLTGSPWAFEMLEWQERRLAELRASMTLEAARLELTSPADVAAFRELERVQARELKARGPKGR